MKKRFFLSSAAVSVFGGLVIHFGFIDSDAQAQKNQATSAKPASTTLTAKVETPASALAGAALANAKLRNSLEWTFGGKTQTGFNIYVPLITHTIGTESGPDTADFALALSKWQEKSGLPVSGVLDFDTLDNLIKYWQSRRLGRAGLSASDLLLTAPIVEFYDPSRSPELLQMERETYAAYKRMIAAATKELDAKITSPGEKFLRIVSAYRSPEYQEALRKKEPNAGRGALAKNSPHSTGHALDIYVGGEPVKTEDSNRWIQVQTAAYKWLVKNAEKFGFYPYFYEPWHWEYVPKQVK